MERIDIRYALAEVVRDKRLFVKSLHTLGTGGFFLVGDEELRQPQADPSSDEGRRQGLRSHEKKPLAQSALIYRAG